MRAPSIRATASQHYLVKIAKNSYFWAGLGLVAAMGCIHARDSTPTTPLPTGKIAALWAVNDGEKIDRHTLDHPAKNGNSAFQDGKVRLFGARNEMLGLQIIVESGAEGIGALRISLSGLVQRGGNGRITYRPPGEDPTEYADRPIQLFSENYMHIEQPTNAPWIMTPGTPAAPANPTGDKPVQLVPENARPGRGGFPVAVPPRTNQAFWIDIYLDRHLNPGHYDGEVHIDADGETNVLPIELEVLNFALPDENSVTYMLYYPGAPWPNVEMYHGRNLDDRYHRFAHRNRVEFVDEATKARIEANLGRFDGTAFQKNQGYEGPGEGVGNQMVPRTFYAPDFRYLDPQFAREDANAWMQFITSRLPSRVRTFFYMPDEPSSDQFDMIREMARNIHDNPGPGRHLPVFVTHAPIAQLSGAIDIWAVTAPQWDPDVAAIQRDQHREMWYYNGQRPNAGAMVIDTPATDARVHGWITYKYAIPVYFYWHVAHWYHNRSAPRDYPRIQNVWANPMTFATPEDGSISTANGDGVLIYPGEDRFHPAEDRGIAGPVSTLQMANPSAAL